MFDLGTFENQAPETSVTGDVQVQVKSYPCESYRRHLILKPTT